MLEIAPRAAAIVRCFGAPRVLDTFPALGAVAGRVAGDELWLIGPPGTAADIVRGATSYLAGADPDGLVVDHGEAWSAWTLAGDHLAAFARLSDITLPSSPAFIQGLVAHLPAKILLRARSLHLVVPVQVGHHVPVRVLEACHDLAPSVVALREFMADEVA